MKLSGNVWLSMLVSGNVQLSMLVSGNVQLSMLVTGPQPEDNGKESGIESESDSGNETISCETVDTSSAGYKEFLANAPSDAFGQRCSSRKLPVDLDTLDIDAFIASVTVPPPPKDDSSRATNYPQCSGSIGRGRTVGVAQNVSWNGGGTTVETAACHRRTNVTSDVDVTGFGGGICEVGDTPTAVVNRDGVTRHCDCPAGRCENAESSTWGEFTYGG